MDNHQDKNKEFYYSMDQSPSSDANSSTESQEIICILRNPKIPHHNPNSPPPVNFITYSLHGAESFLSS